jgi:hypothetical protein
LINSEKEKGLNWHWTGIWPKATTVLGWRLVWWPAGLHRGWPGRCAPTPQWRLRGALGGDFTTVARCSGKVWRRREWKKRKESSHRVYESGGGQGARTTSVRGRRQLGSGGCTGLLLWGSGGWRDELCKQRQLLARRDTWIGGGREG